ncbi:MAG: cytochrome P460 family protein [Bacteriovoracaceae bacterium]
MKKFFFAILLLPAIALAVVDYSGKTEMNGIAWKDYQGYPEKWELVTIRFRKDTGEMRITYANPIAMKALKEGKTDYPEGAVFAKTGIHTGVDPQFISSVVPKGIRRYQIMVRNKKLYSATNGWGYALFDPEGKTFNEDPKVTQDACYACHTIVENRGDVFSQHFSTTRYVKPIFTNEEKKANTINYVTKAAAALPENIRTHVPAWAKEVRFVEVEIMRKHVFQGTLDEMRPILEHESLRSKLPAVFASKDEKRFVIVYPAKSEECMELTGMTSVTTDIKGTPTTERFCLHD